MACTLGVAGLWSPQATRAQDSRRDRGGVTIGAFVTHRDSETRLDSDVGVGTEIDLEKDLGLKSSETVARFGFHYWVKPRQRFDLAIFDLSRSSSRRIDETISFGDQVFDIDTIVETQADLEIYKLDYTFAPVSRDRGYLGVTGGLYVAQTRLGLAERTLGTFESEDLTAPLPVVGVRGEVNLSDRVTLGGAAQWFAVDTGDASGRFRDFYVGADYRFGRRVRLGLAYNAVAMNVEAKENNGFNGRLDWGYDGWLLYLQAGFGL